MAEGSLCAASHSHRFSAENVFFRVCTEFAKGSTNLSLKDVLVHGIALANNEARSIEELLAFLSLCEDSLHAEVLYQVVVARETLKDSA